MITALAIVEDDHAVVQAAAADIAAATGMLPIPANAFPCTFFAIALPDRSNSHAMEFGSINEFLDRKIFLVTGATGFIAKIFVEKLFRVQPNLKKLYLLVRANNSESAAGRVKSEIIRLELFDRLRGAWGKDFDSLVSKMIAVAGDSSCANLGIDDPTLREQLWKEIDVVVSVAATTKFYDRYDVAFNTNTLGALHILDFAKKCENLQFLCKWRKGRDYSRENIPNGRELNGTSKLDIEEEKRLINETLEDLVTRQVPQDSIKKIMRELGDQRAKQYGWPNVYVFTKSMGEMLMSQWKGNLPVVVLRPTIVTSTLKEPIPGWIEGIRMIDPFLVAYGKGRLNLLFSKDSSRHSSECANQRPCMALYQIGSSFRNPITIREVFDFSFRYFAEKPWTDIEGKSVIVRRILLLGNSFAFQIISWLIILAIKVLRLMNMASMILFQDFADNLQGKLTTTMKFHGVYGPYLHYDGIFKDDGMEELRVAARRNGVDETTFFLDPKSIDWEDYFLRVHIPGVVRRLF
ncbi:Alcohol-forming fatty acyl-CoA reductase-like protein [Drosera capensis]